MTTRQKYILAGIVIALFVAGFVYANRTSAQTASDTLPADGGPTGRAGNGN